MRLLVQPEVGVAPLVRGISKAKETIDLLIFRFDQREIERALVAAVKRGVAVRALIAHTNRAGEDGLRRLEMRLLSAGVTVARTADEFARYHGKVMVIDRRELYVMAFNLTYMDTEHSRSFAVITRSRLLVGEALKLIEADTARHSYEPGSDRFLVSPVNARRQLAQFIKSAKKQLLIYDPKVSDRSMLRFLEERLKAGVDVRIIGQVEGKRAGLTARKLKQMRLHARAIVRDGRDAFIGSQSLRQPELDGRREVGILFRESDVVRRLAQIFEEDWAFTDRSAEGHAAEVVPARKVAKKVAKAVAKDLPPLAPVLNGAVKRLPGAERAVKLDVKQVEETVKNAVKDAVKEVVQNAVEKIAGPKGGN